MTQSSVGSQRARQVVGAAVVDRLRELGRDRLTVYGDGEIVDEQGRPTAPPVLVVDGIPNAEGRVAPYAIVWPGIGEPTPNPSLDQVARDGGDFLWSCQVTFAAGYLNDLLAVLDEAVPLLQLWSPTIPGLSCGRMRPPSGFEGGYPRRDDRARPSRFTAVTQWRLHYAGASTAP